MHVTNAALVDWFMLFAVILFAVGFVLAVMKVPVNSWIFAFSGLGCMAFALLVA